MKYLLLQNPGHNRVYYNLADKLALAELKIASVRFSVKCLKTEIQYIQDIRYIYLETESELSAEDLDILSRLSFLFAIFQMEEINGKNYLLPLKKVSYEVLDPKISSILKYPGKTNELFTKMMLNVALLSSDFEYSDKIKLLDPLSGKGTTIFEGLVYGFDSFGIEKDSKFVHEADTYFRKYLENDRIKHHSGKRLVSGKKKADAVYICEYEFAMSKEDFKAAQNIIKAGFVAGDTQDSSKYFPPKSFHLIVGDLPYGIFHGSSGGKKNKATTRNPSELLESCLSEYYQLLKPGGALVLAWNSFLISRKDLTQKFESAGFDVLTHSPYDEFEHKVDISIKRDIMVCRGGSN